MPDEILHSGHSDGLANTLFTELLDGKSFAIPAVDLTDPNFQIPSEAGNDLYADIDPLHIDELTTGTIGGTGSFDKIMTSIAAHLRGEYDSGRIAGNDYASAYVAMTQSALSAATQFLLSRDQAYWQAHLVQQQSRIAEIQGITARAELERTKVELVGSQAKAETLAAEYTLTKIRLASEDANFRIAQVQKANIEADTAIKDWELVNILPKQRDQIQGQIDLSGSEKLRVDAQTNQVSYETSDLMPAQKSDIIAATAIKTYQSETLLPAEKAAIDAKAAQVTYETSFVLPSQKAKIDADTANVAYQTTDLLPTQKSRILEEIDVMHSEIGDTLVSDPLTSVTGIKGAQKANIEAGTAQTAYETGNTLPAQLGKITKETSVLDYNLTAIMPKEAARIQNQIDIGTGQISKLTAEENQVLYQTASILPAQKLNIEADTDVKEYQATTLLPAQVAGHTADTTGKTYTNDFILPEQYALVQEQVESTRAKTMDTRTDGVTAVAGAIGKQKDLQQQQIDSYKRDSESKVVKMILDTWVTQKSMDEDLVPPTSLNDANINTVVGRLQANTGMAS